MLSFRSCERDFFLSKETLRSCQRDVQVLSERRLGLSKRHVFSKWRRLSHVRVTIMSCESDV